MIARRIWQITIAALAASAVAVVASAILSVLAPTANLSTFHQLAIGISILASGLMIWSTGLLYRRDRSAYCAVLACFVAGMCVSTIPNSVAAFWAQNASVLALILAEIVALRAAVKRAALKRAPTLQATP